MRKRSIHQRDWENVAVLAFDGNNVIAGVIGGRRDGEYQYFPSSTYAASVERMPWEFKQPIRVTDQNPAPASIRFKRTDYFGMTVEAGYDRQNQSWYLKETTGIQPPPQPERR